MTRPLRVLLASAESHPTHRADVRVLFGKSLPALGVTTDLLTLVEAADRKVPWTGGKLLSRLVSARNKRRQIPDFLQQLSLFRRCPNYDVLIVRDKPVLSLIGWLAARLTGTPFAYWMSFPLPEAYLDLASKPRAGMSPLRRANMWLRARLGGLILYRFVMHRADWLFVQSDQMIRELHDKGLKHHRLSAVPMGVDIEAIPSAATERPSDLADRKLAVYIGTLDRARQLDVLIDAALIVARRHPDFLLLMMGEADEPSDRGWIQQYATSVNADQVVRFTGKLPSQTCLDLARHAVVGLSTFPRRAFLESASPTKAVEYLAVHVPVVGNDQPDQAKVIRESGGGWCVPLTAQDFADAIEACLNDPEQARRMASAGYDYVREHRSYRILAEPVAQQLRSMSAHRPAALGRAPTRSSNNTSGN